MNSSPEEIIMQTISIRKISITKVNTEIIVNAANNHLQHGAGVCGYIFEAAGPVELQKACNRIGYCPAGSAVITQGFRLCKYIVHAVGPVWHGGTQHEPQQLYDCYKASLNLAKEYNCHSIGFPLISAGIFSYPTDKAWRKAVQAVSTWFKKNPDYDLDVIFAVLDDQIIKTGVSTVKDIAPSYYKTSSYGNASVQKTAAPADTDQLNLGNRSVKAVFFHLPEEPYGYLSNWYLSSFELDGIHFSSCEQYIMYRKCMIFGDQASADAVLSTDDTETQQSIGKTAKGFIPAVWDGMKQPLLMRGLYAKFTQNEDLKQLLLETGDTYLVECAASDHIWACGRKLTDDRRFDITKWNGQNLLGFALMEVRSALKNH